MIEFCSVCFRLKLILWKNCMIRKHHYILTILEIAIPLVLFILLAYLRNSQGFYGTEYINHPTYCELRRNEYIYFFFHHMNPYQIYYVPKTEFTSKLISKVQLKLNVKDEDVKGLKSESDLIEYYETFGHNKSIRAVVFKDANEQSHHLTYVLKPSAEDHGIPWKWDTESLFYDTLSYRQNIGSSQYLYSGLLAMQMALDTSYIEIMSKQNLPLELTMQEFPYPPYFDARQMSALYLYGLPIVTLLAFLLLYPIVLQRVMDEKITGAKELMKMMGLKSWMLWLGWLVHALMVSVISILLITFFMKVNVFGGAQPVLQFCSASVYAVFLLLYCINTVTYAFLISSFFNRPTLAIIVGISLWVVFGEIRINRKSKILKKIFVSMLSPNMLLKHGYNEIASYESRGIGANWNNLFTPARNSSRDITLGLAFIVFIFSSVLYMLITMYMENVKPGPYGVAKPPHFPALYIWSKISKSNKVEDVEGSGFENNAKIEKPPNLKTGIVVKNLYKNFGKHTVVNNFSIDIYEGQITALLGHNGAGKTTTMSIITGMISATSGKVFINNQDIKYNMNKIRSCLGFCPQTNLHFRDLNVTEHLIFFAMLKGSSKKRAEKEAKELLEKMNLYHKRHSKASTLSGGMKRKLSLGMALIGNSKVLILDEPTSGLDPEARREIWDTLLTVRGSRIVIITTHFMEEADVLGDRVAIMDHGQLMCYGTSMYLKKEYGAGYNLTLVRDEEAFKAQNPQGSSQVETITSVVNGRIRSASLISTNGNNITFLLPHDMKPYFGDLLGAIESKKGELCISNIALSVTTIEEVFLKVDSSVEEAKRVKQNNDQLEGDNISFVTNPSTKHTGFKLLRMQLRCLFKKRRCFLRRKWILFVVAIMIAVAATILTLYYGEEGSYAESQGRFDFVLSQYGKTTVITGEHGSDALLGKVQQQYKQLVESHGSIPKEVDSVSNAIILNGINNIAFYKDFMVVAAEFNISSRGKTVNAMYSNPAVHGAPISLNLLTNAIVKAVMGSDYSISTSFAPLPKLSEGSMSSISSLQSVLMWFLLFPLGVLFLTGIFLIFPHMEKASNIKQLQLMCGVRAVSYWFVCYIFDIVLYLIAVAVIVIGILIYGTIGSKAFSGVNEIGTLLLLLLGYGLSAIPYVYLYSYKKTAASAFVWYFIVTMLLGVICTPFLLMYDLKCGKYLLFLIPYVGLTTMLTQFSYKAVWKYNWDKKTPDQKELMCQEPSEHNPCCAGDDTPQCVDYRSYLSSITNKFSYYHLLIMAASSILYFAILLLLESNFVQKLWERFFVMVFNCLTPKSKKRESVGEHDREDVIIEMNIISNQLKQKHAKSRGAGEGSSSPTPKEEDLLLVHQLEKRFALHRAVKGVSFTVKPGECFGLLGVNGAGKTTTFRILTGDLPLITGEARVLTPAKGKIYLSKQSTKYLKQVGYCPQFDALNEVLTGREMLRLFADLRGISEGAEEEINMWIKILGLKEHADKRCGLYSGGNKRKLSVAIALIGGPPVVMLDEPTSGVDPVSRRKLWDTLSAIQKQEVKPSIILTSHSMAECEALCNNLVIMKAGRLECYGTIPNIKKKYAQGFTVMLKLKITSSKPEEDIKDTPEGSKSKSQSQGQTSSIEHLQNKPNKSSQSRGQTPSDNEKPIVAEDSKEVKDVMKDIETMYKEFCTLKDKHTGLLHYHINDKNKKWSQMFKEIEKLQQKHPIIEDYNISETTLEEVFLSIARSED